MADSPLDGIWAKLRRGDESLDTLEHEWKLGQNVKPIGIAFEFDTQTEWHTAHIVGIHAEPRLGVLASEFLHHARSSLDHIVFLLVKANHKKPGRHNAFPIWETGTKADFMHDTPRPRRGKRRPGELHGVSVNACAFIEQLQPYNARHPHLPHHSFLHRLHVMAREDRHQALHQAFVWTDPTKISRSLFAARSGSTITRFRRLYRPWQSMVEGTKIARLRVEPINPEAQVDVQEELTVDIAFGSRFEVIALQALRDVNRNVRQTISFLQEFL